MSEAIPILPPPAQMPRRTPVGLLSAPVDVRLRRARISGRMLALCKAVTSARSYQWRYASGQPPTAWTQSDQITAARYALENLVPGTIYTVQVRVFGTKGPSDWSDAASLMAT